MIDPTAFKPELSRWGDIFVTLADAGFDVYSPSTKVGECLAPYVVVKDDGVNRHAAFSSDVATYSVMCYVPKDAYSTLEPFVKSVRDTLKALRPMVEYNGSITPSFYDDGVKAHMVSIGYRNYKQLL